MPFKSSKNKEVISPQEETFIQQLLKGETQRKSFCKAFPNRANWKPSAIDSAASKLFKDDRIFKRYNELLNAFREQETEKTGWTREQSIETLRYVIDRNVQDLDRIHKAYDDELEFILRQMEENPVEAMKYTRQLISAKKSRRVSLIHNTGITGAVAELNKMQGFNEETVNLTGAVVFTGEDQMQD